MNWNHPSVSFDNSFDSKFKESSWKRTTGIERSLCNRIYNSTDFGFTNSKIVSITRWKPEPVKDWLWLLYMEGVLDKCRDHSSRWRLARGVYQSESELLEVLPPIGCIINHRTSTLVIREPQVHEELVLPSYYHRADSNPTVDPSILMDFNGGDLVFTQT
jgi:hypothetical protein